MAVTVELITPSSGSITTDSTPDFQARYGDPTYWGYITFELDISTSFNSPVKQTGVIGNLVDQQIATWTPTVLSDGVWYWRANSTNSNNDSSSWSSAWSIDENLGAKKRALAIYENIAKLNVFTKKRVLAIYENISKVNVFTKKRGLSIYENISKLDIWTKTRALYDYENITSDPPFPWIEYLSTTRAARGSVVSIYGSGFGAKPDNDPNNADRSLCGYGGFVYIGNMLCNIVSWSWQQIVFQLPQEAESGAVKVILTVPNPPGVRSSNVIGFEVYEVEPADDIGIELFVCDKNNPNTVLCQLDGATAKSFQVLLNNPGSGKFAISRYDSKGGNQDYVTDQNFVLCRLDGVDIFKWVIESRRPSFVDEGEQQLIEVSGRGVLSLLDRGVVYPEGMPYPGTIDRAFSNVHGGAIFRQLLLEAQQRGCLTGIAVDWTADADSIGNPFGDSTTLSFHAGTPLSQVATKLSEGMGLFDLEMSPSLHLKLYKSKGTDRYDLVKYRPGQAIIRHQNQSDSARITNALLVEGESGGLVETAHPTSQTDWGRREGYLQARNIPSEWAKLQDYGQLFLKTAALVSWGIQGTVTQFRDSNGVKLKPFESFILGDWIGWTIPSEGSDDVGFDGKVRVKGITCEENPDTGALSYTLELNNIMLEHEINVAQLVERMSMYSSNSSLANPATESPSGISHNHTHSLLNGLNTDDHPQYLNDSRHATDPHSAISRVSSLKRSGANALTGDVILAPGTNVTIAQDDALKTITISASGGGGSSYEFPIDEPPVIPHDKDDEFNDTSLNAKWSWVNQGAATWSESNGYGKMILPSVTGDNMRVLVQSKPAGDFTMTMKLQKLFTPWNNYFNAGLVMRDSTSGRLIMWGLCKRSTFEGAHYMKFSSPTVFSSEPFLRAFSEFKYLRCRFVGITVYADFSYDGSNWIQHYSETITSFLTGFDQIGIGMFRNNNDGISSYFTQFDWFRVTQP